MWRGSDALRRGTFHVDRCNELSQVGSRRGEKRINRSRVNAIYRQLMFRKTPTSNRGFIFPELGSLNIVLL